jgi:hypothetical protein
MRIALLAIMLTACGEADWTALDQDQGVDQTVGDQGSDNGSWKVECFPDMGMCRAFRWQYSVVSASCERSKGCECSIGVGKNAETFSCPLGPFKPDADAGLEAMLACCFKH